MAVKNTFFHNGAKFVRADFHLHTKADSHFAFTGDADYFVSNYIQALKEAGIRIGILTNHNRFDLNEFRALAKFAAKNDIFIMPGVELSVNDGANGVHMLVVFSNDWIADNVDHIGPLLTALFPGRSISEIASADSRTNVDLIHLVDLLDGYNKEYFLVAAHVDQNSGLFKELGGGRIEELKDEKYGPLRRRLLACQKVRAEATRGRLQTLSSEWHPAEVEGSDPKNIDEVGLPNGGVCFLKVGRFDFDAVAFALRDPCGRVRRTDPQSGHSHIVSVRYEGGILNGVSIPFSDGLNALVGIRGSGKSAILETIRYGLELGREGQVPEPDREYKQKLVDFALGSGGKVIVETVDRFGQCYRVERINRDAKSTVYLDDVVQPGLTISETVVSRPVYFGQKDLSSRGDGFESELIEKLVGERFSEPRHVIAQCETSVLEAAQKLNSVSSDFEYLEELRVKCNDINRQLEAFKAVKLEEKFEDQLRFQAHQAKVDKYQDALASYIGSFEPVRECAESIESELNIFPDRPELSKEGSRIAASVKRQVEQIDKAVISLKAEFEKIGALQRCIGDERRKRADAFAETLRLVAQDVGAAGDGLKIQPNEFIRLREQLAQTKQAVELLERKVSQGVSRKASLHAELAKLKDARQKEFLARQALLSSMNTDAIQVEVSYRGNREEFRAKFKELVRGRGVRGTTIDGLVEKYADFADMYCDWDNAQKYFGSNPSLIKQTVEDNLGELLSYRVPDEVVIRYHGKPLQEHSLGQRASALMMFVLMQQDRDVVFIDQPEDDLDNQTLYKDVIKFLWKRKENVQFVFATHNPNIPVLGDAEQVVSCTMHGQTVSVQCGSLDDPQIRNRIIQVMEGGREAFERRRDIYTLWN